jgi:hypothetical protein
MNIHVLSRSQIRSLRKFAPKNYKTKPKRIERKKVFYLFSSFHVNVKILRNRDISRLFLKYSAGTETSNLVKSSKIT